MQVAGRRNDDLPLLVREVHRHPTTISPGVTESELASTITHEGSIAAMRDFRRVAIPASAVAEAISWAIAQPDAVDVSEIIVRPTAGPY